jgi:WD40 repeat protein
VETGECLGTFQGHRGAVVTAKFSPDDRSIVSGGFDSTLKVWEVETGQCLKTLVGHSGLIYSLDVAKSQLSGMDSPKLLAFSGSIDETIKVWDLETNECLETWKTPSPYAGMRIDNLQGLTQAQKATLQALGAIYCNNYTLNIVFP